ncbi:MAG: DNA repair protein RecN [Elainellaceae cyanobacterium]
MLIALDIENFALVDRLELQFGTGLNVLTGETGAGKSIILDALDAALGGKVSGRAVRTGADSARIEATFSLEPALAEWLAAQEIEPIDESTLVCSREMTLGQGSVRSRSRVNGVVVNKQQMEELRDRLVEITAQGQTVQLGQPSLQRDWLDSFGGAVVMQQREAVAIAHAAFQQAAQALEKRRQMEQQRQQQLDLFEYQAKELAAANLSDPQELEQLEQERQRLGHTVELQQQSYHVYQALYQNDSGGSAAADLLGKAENWLTDMVRYDRELEPVLDMVADALARVQEAGRLINTYGEGLETDPERLEQVEQRIIQLKQICKKYGPTLAEAIAYAQRVQADVEALSDGGQSLEALETQYAQRQQELASACAQLTELRRVAAQMLEARIIEELKPLAMEKVQFQVEISPVAPTAAGGDRITFLFSPNPGEPLQPLTAIASGGEMSRFLLALKVCFSQVDPIGTMVFDEIDVGVSGRVAQAIADKLRQLGGRHQVLCVTHQPLVAAMAHTHFRVDKQVIDPAGAPASKNGRKKSKAAAESLEAEMTEGSEDVRTVVRVSQLSDEQRRHELAQLVGGNEEAIAFADSLLAQAASRQQEAIAKTPAKPKRGRSGT